MGPRRGQIEVHGGLNPTNPRVSVAGGDEERDFYVQRNTGTISIARRLDAARRSVYNMTVQVTDGRRSATAQVREDGGELGATPC